MKALLKKLDAQIAKKAPHAAAALRPPADAEALARLDARYGGAAPADLKAWYAWHDGEQDGPGVGFDPDSTFFPIALDEGLRVSREVLDPGYGHPILSNGGGAWVCHLDGALMAVWRGELSTWAPSLEAWVEKVTAALSKVKVSRIPAPAAAYTFAPVDPVPSNFDHARALMAAATPGTVYLLETPLMAPPGRPSPGVSCALFVRTAPGEWLAPLVGHAADRAKALTTGLEQWRTFASKAPGKSSGYYKLDEVLVISLVPRNGATLLIGTPYR